MYPYIWYGVDAANSRRDALSPVKLTIINHIRPYGGYIIEFAHVALAKDRLVIFIVGVESIFLLLTYEVRN